MTGWLEFIPAVSSLLDRIIPDPDARERAKQELIKAENAHALKQLELALSADAKQTAINETEAQHPRIFVSGWRPFIGWVCGVAFAYHYIIQPLCIFIMVNRGVNVELPEFAMDELTTVLMGLLGLGGLRTIEKLQKNRAK